MTLSSPPGLHGIKTLLLKRPHAFQLICRDPNSQRSLIQMSWELGLQNFFFGGLGGHSLTHNRNLKHSIENKSIPSIPQYFLGLPHPFTSKSWGRVPDFSDLKLTPHPCWPSAPCCTSSLPYFLLHHEMGLSKGHSLPRLLPVNTFPSLPSLEAGVLLQSPLFKPFKASSSQKCNQTSPSPARCTGSDLTSADSRSILSVAPWIAGVGESFPTAWDRHIFPCANFMLWVSAWELVLPPLWFSVDVSCSERPASG